MITKECEFCGDEFECKEYSTQKYCSTKCVGDSQRKRIQKECQYCGDEFEVVPSKKDKKFCSIECVGKNKTARHSEQRECKFCRETFRVPKSSDRSFCSDDCRYSHISKQASEIRECEFCGEGFEVIKSSKQKFCSQACFGKNRHINNSVEKTCPHCNESFRTANGADHTFCSHKCFRAHEIETRRSKLRDCEYCGAEFLAKPIAHNKDGYAKFCSDQCYKNYLEDNHRERRECKNCGDEFIVIKAVVEDGGGDCCSWGCFIEYIRQGEYRNCKECGEEFYLSPREVRDKYNHQYCSKKCHGEGRTLYPNTIALRRKVQALRSQAKDYVVRNTDMERDEIPEPLIELKMAKDKFNRTIKEEKNG